MEDTNKYVLGKFISRQALVSAAFLSSLAAMNPALLIADVLLPFPLRGSFSYYVPEELQARIQVGFRVIVPFGPSKIYTAIVKRLYTPNKEDLQRELKSIEQLIDEQALVTEDQLRFWEWIAAYYMCTEGEVMQAALPSVFKLSSETRLLWSPLAEENFEDLNAEEYLLAQAMSNRREMSIAEVQSLLERKRVMPVIKHLMEKGFISLQEELNDKVKPRVESYVELNPIYRTEEKLRLLFQDLEADKRAVKQIEALMLFIQLDKERKGLFKKALLFHPAFSSSPYQSLLKKEILIESKKVVSRIENKESKLRQKPELSVLQQDALAQIENIWKEKDTVLLHGVTGSGKTLLYAEAGNRFISEGKKILYLVPEIALTGQLRIRLEKIWGNRLVVYHSRLSDQQRAEVYRKVLEKDYDVLLGARSALLLPIQQTALFLIDEEHDPSYKQSDPAPRYQARDAALVLARQTSAKVLLGSATPSFESYFNAKSGKYGLVRLTERYGEAELPQIQVIDLREAVRKRKMHEHFSDELLEAIRNRIERREQSILFLNKRGYARFVQCSTCGWSPHCKRCENALSLHKFNSKLVCHLCGWNSPMLSTCKQCKSETIIDKGFGTEKIEEELKRFIPELRIERMDYDSTRGKKAFEQLLDRFAWRELDVLAGTQMVTKGLDFEHVKLVGVMQADQLLHFPDFRAEERAFQLLTQVSGRAGRKGQAGVVYIQSYDPQHPVIQRVVAHDYEGFYKQQMSQREKFDYPPFCRMIHLSIRHRDKNIADQATQFIYRELRDYFKERLLGPIIPAVSRINNYYLRKMLIKPGKGSGQVAQAKEKILRSLVAMQQFKELKYAQLICNVDP